MRTRFTLLAAAAAALVLGAAGCGDSGTHRYDRPGDRRSVGREGRGGDGVLALGRAAVAPFVDYGTPNQSKKTKVGVRVHEVRKGRIADFKGFNLEPAQRRATPYYVDATFENRGGFALVAQPAPGVGVLAPGASGLQFHPELRLGVQDRLQAVAERRTGERSAERGRVLEEVVARLRTTRPPSCHTAIPSGLHGSSLARQWRTSQGSVSRPGSARAT